MNRSRPRRAASRRGRSREASPTSQVDEYAHEPPRDESEEEQATKEALPPRRSGRKKRGVLSPSQTTLTSFFPMSNTGDPSSDELNDDGAGDSQDEDANDEKEMVKPRNEQHQDMSTPNENGTRAEESKAEEKSEPAKDEPQAPLASLDLEADKSNVSTGTREEKVSTGMRTDEREDSSHEESSAVSHDNNKDAPSGPSVIAGHDDVGQHGKSSLAYILPRPLNEIPEANVRLPKRRVTGDNKDGGDGVCRKNESPRASANKAPRDESSERTPSTSPQGSNVYYGYTLMSSKVGSAEHVSTEVQRVRSEQPETRTVSIDSKIAFEGAAGNDHENPLKMFASPQVSLNLLHMLSQVSVGMIEAKEVVVPSSADDSSRLMKQEEQEKIDVNSEAKGTESHSIPDQQRVVNDSTSKPPNEAALVPIEQRIAPPSVSATSGFQESAGISTAQQSQAKVHALGDAAGTTSSANGDDQGGTNAKPNYVTCAISSFGGDRDKGNSDAEGSDIARRASARTEDGCKQNGIGPSLIGQGQAVLSPQEQSFLSAAKVDSAFYKELAVDEKCTVTGASNQLVETHSLDGPLAKISERAEDAVTDGAREHSLSDAQGYGGSAIHRRADIPTSVPSSLVQVSMQAQDTMMKRTPQHEPSTPAVSQAPQHEFLDVEDIKIRLYDIGSRVHRGKSPERRFAAYWEALTCFVSFRLQRGGRSTTQSTFDGVRKVLDSFLKTKQMRRLHNLLILGLMEQCTKDYVIDNGIRNHIPGLWQEKIRTHRVDTKPIMNDMVLTPIPVAETLSGFDLSGYNRLSEMWTATGREPLISHSVHVAASSSALVIRKEIVQLPRHSQCLPGALSVDPLVRNVIRDAAMKVSETAIWILVVAVREYVRSLLNDTISNLESFATEHSLAALDFSQCAIRSGNMGMPEETDCATHRKRNGSNEQGVAGIMQLVGQKRRCISSLDIAATLNRTRMAPEGSLAGSVQPLAYERCCQASLNGNCVSLPPAFDSVQSFIVDSIQSASKKPKHEWPDPSPVAAAESDFSSIVEKSSQMARSGSIHSPAGGLGKEAKNLAALRARAAAMTAAPAPELIPIAPAPPTAPKATTATDIMSAGQPSFVVAGDNGATVAAIHPRHVEGDRPPSISPRGRGKGFGVKNLAAMRARSAPTLSSDNLATDLASWQQDGSEQQPESVQTANASVQLATNQNGGKEPRHLQEVQATSPFAVSPTSDEAKGVSVLPLQGHADATQL